MGPDYGVQCCMRESQTLMNEVEPDHDRLTRERDLYRGLLNLNTHSSPDACLEEALELVVVAASANQGYLEIFDPSDQSETSWWRATGFSDEELDRVRQLVSRGIIAEAVATGEVVVTASALLDPRFRDRDSVKRSKIDSVLCAPVGKDAPLGVLYLSGRDSPGPFTDEDVVCAKQFSEHVAPIFQNLVKRSQADNDDPTSELRQRLQLDELVGRSAAVAALLREVELIAPLEVGVLVTGEKGTGKTRLGRIIHNNSKRRGQPLVVFDCAAVSEPLVERELFGHVDAGSSSNNGRIASAEGGTLILEEISELSLSAQAKLLRFLRSREYSPIDGDRLLTGNARLIATTSADLAEAVKRNEFREDLLYQLQVLTVRLPSLSERREDVVPLAHFFCQRAVEKHKLSRVVLSPGAVRAIEASEWRGNIYELASAVESAVLRAAAQRLERVEASHLFRENDKPEDALTFQEATRVFQSYLLRRTLEATGWNVAAAARKLDLTRAHVYNLIKAYGLRRSDEVG
jgi:Nif-specific regulatory protein